MESSPESTITQAFNPFAATDAAFGMGATGLIYEPLIQFDIASPPKYYPWLATSYAWGTGGKSITFTIRQGVKWNNGTPFTPADVAFTYRLGAKPRRSPRYDQALGHHVRGTSSPRAPKMAPASNGFSVLDPTVPRPCARTGHSGLVDYLTMCGTFAGAKVCAPAGLARRVPPTIGWPPLTSYIASL
jgi:ABC-type transport system substrate-binding protein